MTYVAGTRKVRDSTYGTGVSTVGAGGSKISTSLYQDLRYLLVHPEGERSGTIPVMAIESQSDLYIARSDLLLNQTAP